MRLLLLSLTLGALTGYVLTRFPAQPPEVAWIEGCVALGSQREVVEDSLRHRGYAKQWGCYPTFAHYVSGDRGLDIGYLDGRVTRVSGNPRILRVSDRVGEVTLDNFRERLGEPDYPPSQGCHCEDNKPYRRYWMVFSADRTRVTLAYSIQ